MAYKSPLIRGYYPFPDVPPSPHMEQLKRDAEEWIDNDYKFLTEKSRKVYKAQNLHAVAARMLPNPAMQYEHIRAACRWLVMVTVFDDCYELADFETIKDAAERTKAILDGGDPLPEENALYIQAGVLRDELNAIAPLEWMTRFTKHHYEFILYGILEESSYIEAQKQPSVEYYEHIRQQSIAALQISDFIELEIGFFLSEYLANHPMIQRLRTLTTSLIGHQNDFHSYLKETARSRMVCDLISVMRQQHNLSLPDAVEKARQYHDGVVSEFKALQSALPSFGAHQKQVENYVIHLGIQVQGLNTWHLLDTARYDPGGYIEPEYVASAGPAPGRYT